MNFIFSILSFLLFAAGPSLELIETDEAEELLVLDETGKVIGFIDGEEVIPIQEVDFESSDEFDEVED